MSKVSKDLEEKNSTEKDKPALPKK